MCVSLPSCTSTRRGCFIWLLINITHGQFLCRFSPFVKTGTESFVLGAASVKSSIPDRLQVTIIVSPEGTCTIMYQLSLVLWQYVPVIYCWSYALAQSL